MQVPSDDRPGAAVRPAALAIPDERGLDAWRAFLQAHATLMRELSVDLSEKAGLSLGDFDVLAQLGLAGGELRVTHLAARVFLSRSALSRRLDRMVEEGLVHRTKDEADRRGVVIAMTEYGQTRLTDAVPIHLSGVRALFLTRLDDEELSVLERALGRVSRDCSFG